MIGLTQKQKECLAFIKLHVEQYGYAPSVRDTVRGLGVRSTSNVHRLFSCLEERGYIRRLPGKARAIELVDERSSVRRIVAEEFDRIRIQMPKLAMRLERAMGVCDEPL